MEGGAAIGCIDVVTGTMIVGCEDPGSLLTDLTSEAHDLDLLLLLGTISLSVHVYFAGSIPGSSGQCERSRDLCPCFAVIESIDSANGRSSVIAGSSRGSSVSPDASLGVGVGSLLPWPESRWLRLGERVPLADDIGLSSPAGDVAGGGGGRLVIRRAKDDRKRSSHTQRSMLSRKLLCSGVRVSDRAGEVHCRSIWLSMAPYGVMSVSKFMTGPPIGTIATCLDSIWGI